MEEDLDSRNFIRLDIEEPSELKNLNFIPNRKLFNSNIYSNILSTKNNFKPSKLMVSYFGYKISNIILPFIYFCIFYLLLITVILTKSTLPIIFLPIIYIIGQYFQGGILPYPIYGSRENFFIKINQILNASTKLNLCDNNFFDFKGKYTFDVTGQIDIPDTINNIKIGKIQYFIENEYYNINRKWGFTYFPKIIYEDKYIENTDIIYSLNFNQDTPPFNGLIFILSIFLLQWINALIFRNISLGDVIVIYPAKLIIVDLNNNKNIPESNFTVHGQTLDIEKYTINPINEDEYDRIVNELEEEERKEKEEKKQKEEEEREKRKNTKQLSEFSDNHYRIKVYKYYNTVYADVYVENVNGFRDGTFFRTEIDLGQYEPDVEESERKEAPNHWIKIPKGKNKEIQIIKTPGKLTILIGEKFHESFNI